MSRSTESRKAVVILREILEENARNAQRRRALQLAISVLEARAFDAEKDEG